MKLIIIPKEQVERYTRKIEVGRKGKYVRYWMIQPIPVKTDKGIVYTLPPEVLQEKKIMKDVTTAKSIGEVPKLLSEYSIQDIKIIPEELEGQEIIKK